MLEVHRIAEPTSEEADGELVLDFDARQKSRFRARLADGTEVAVRLPRGSELSQGTCLRSDDGRLLRVIAAFEPLSVTRTDDPVLLARAAYHLGNRHVPLEITGGRLQYRHDHVLDAMLRRLGLSVAFEHGPFVPESGAYGRGHVHEHGEHDHDHDHDAPGGSGAR